MVSRPLPKVKMTWSITNHAMHPLGVIEDLKCYLKTGLEDVCTIIMNPRFGTIL